MSLFDAFTPAARPVARLVADHGLHGGGAPDQEFARGRLIAPGLRQVTVTVRRGAVSGPVDPADLGGWTQASRLGVEGLRRLRSPRHSALRTPTGARVDTFVSDDVFGASRLLVLDQLLADHLLVERPEHGLLLAVPNRHLLAVHLLESITAVPAALELLAELALVEHRIAGPVSPWVYYRSPSGQLSLLTSVEGDGRLHETFDAALRRLAEVAG
jgi:hypothetical protein